VRDVPERDGALRWVGVSCTCCTGDLWGRWSREDVSAVEFSVKLPGRVRCGGGRDVPERDGALSGWVCYTDAARELWGVRAVKVFCGPIGPCAL
jgi:hypothetical protein